MVRSELVDIMTIKMPHIPVQILEESIKTIFETMSNNLSSGNRIELRNFGVFSLHFHAPHASRNPRTGELIMTKGRYHVHFKSGKEMRDKVNAEETV